MTPEFHKIRRLPPYVFEEVNRLKARLRAEGADIIDFGMGNPDMPTPSHIVDKLIETARDPKAGRYSASKGVIGLRKAMAGYYGKRFGVKLDPETEVVATLGSKEGFANLAQALTAPGDTVICPNPAYPIHAYGFIMAGGVIRHVPALSPEQYLSGIDRAMKHSAPPPTVLILSYPSNPTAQWVDLDFYKEAVALAKKHELIILSDIAYSEIYFEDNPPPSLLQVEGAKDIAVEVNSLSKTYAMAGWRVGMVVGNARICAALARVKSYLDYGAFLPVQVAAAAALNGPQDCVAEIRATYKSRRDCLVESMGRAGPTAAAVAADIADVIAGVRRPVFQRPAAELKPLSPAPPGARKDAAYLRLMVRDAPGVLAAITEALADAGVSIDSLLQRPVRPEGLVPIVLTTQPAPEAALDRAVAQIAALEAVAEPPRRLRVARI